MNDHSRAAIRKLLGDLRDADSLTRQPVLDAIEAIKKYIFTVGAQRRLCPPYQGDYPYTPNADEFFRLVGGLRGWAITHSPINTTPVQDFSHTETCYQLDGKPATSGTFQPGKPEDWEWQRDAGKADATLNDLRAWAQGPTDPVPWSGPGWEELRGKAKQLLRFMSNRAKATYDELAHHVWEGEEISSSAVDGAIHKANTFLGKQGYSHFLSNNSRERIVRWS